MSFLVLANISQERKLKLPFIGVWCVIVSLPGHIHLYFNSNLPCFLSSADFFLKSTLSKNSFRNTSRVSNRLVPDQARHFVDPGLCTICLQRLPVDDSSRP